MSNVRYDFLVDGQGPRGISLASWLDRDRLALIVIDAQNYICRPEFSGTWTADGQDDYYYARCNAVVLPAITALIRLFRDMGRPVIYTRIAALNRNLADVPGLTRKVLAEETKYANGRNYHLYVDEPASQIDERVAPAADDIVICKTASGAFCSAETDSILRNNGISRLVFTGGLTDACVSSSVREAFDRGYLCTIVEDACLTTSRADHEAALRSLAKFFGWVTTSRQVIDYLQRAAQPP